MIDGCTRIGMLRRVMIPLMGPGILTAGIFVFLFAFQEYLTALVLTDTSPRPCRCSSPPSSVRPCRCCSRPAPPRCCSTLPVIGIAFIAQKYLVAGLSDGAVKG